MVNMKNRIYYFILKYYSLACLRKDIHVPGFNLRCLFLLFAQYWEKKNRNANHQQKENKRIDVFTKDFYNSFTQHLSEEYYYSLQGFK